MKKNFKIHDKYIGEDYPCFIIAEAGVNHNGSLDKALELVDIAKSSGADAVKFQTFKAENLNLPNAPKSNYHIETTGNDKKQTWYELLKTQELTYEMHLKIFDHCKKNEIIFLSTPYDIVSAELLLDVGVKAFKIASSDTNNIPFLSFLANKNLPIILSSAMSTMAEVSDSINAIKNLGCDKLALLQCTGNYPSKLDDSNLNVINTYKKNFECIVGYSDHTIENINPVAATAMGAKIYEKHFTIDKNLPGPDHRMSLNFQELKKTIDIIRDTEKALGSFEKKVLESEKDNRKKLRKSIVTKRNLKKGDTIKKDDISIKRPGFGIPPKYFNDVIGSHALVDIENNTSLTFEMIDKNIDKEN